MFTRVAIVNRGEPAVRLIRAVRELNAEHGAGIRTVALHTAAEAGAMFVRQADEAVLIGPPAGSQGGGEAGSDGSGNPYLDHAELKRALSAAEADAAWPGWGFVAEQPEFVELCAELGITFLGPSAAVMRALGDKIGAKRLAEDSGVPVAPWSSGPVETLDDARKQGGGIGYPLVIKAAAGGGGRGIRTVERESELDLAYQRARDEAQRSFGDPTVFMERLLRGVRHIEVQVAADDAGAVWALGVRDCTIQRRKQKVIEESSSTALSPEQDRQLRDAAARLARSAGYRNVGTVEFLYQPDEDAFSFLEVNPRLQVEHTVTELTTGQDLVKLQLRLAAGARLDGEPPAVTGHAVEARLNAEDPEREFAPAPGTIELLALPSGPGVRVDTGVDEGDVIPPEYDSMIAKVMAWGRDRAEARSRLHRALAETTVVVRGGITNKGFLLDLLDRPEVRSGRVHTAWLDGLDGGTAGARSAEVGLLVAAVNSYEAEAARERARFYESAARGRPHVRDEVGHLAELRHHGNSYRVEVTEFAPRRYRCRVDGAVVDLALERPRRLEARIDVAGTTFRGVAVADTVDQLVEIDGTMHRFSPDEGGVVRAPTPAMVVAINAGVGEPVTAGASVAALESMKMEVPVPAPFDGQVAEVFVPRNTQVAAGAPLLRIEPVAGAAEQAVTADRLRLDGLATPAGTEHDRDRALERLDVLRHLLLGYDIATADGREVADQYTELRQRLPADDDALLRHELDTLRIFADLCELSRNRRAGDNGRHDEDGQATEDGEETRSPREHLHAFLRSLDADAEGLPEGFRAKLARALTHYGIDELDRTPALEQACYRIFLAQQRAGGQVPAVLAVLDRSVDAEALPGELAGQFRQTLDRVIVATQLRYPSVGELARSVRYRCFDAPVLERNRREVFEQMRSELAYLAAHPEAPDYAERIERLVARPQPLIRLLAGRAGAHDIEPHEPMLEVLTRRFYRSWPLQRFRSLSFEGQQFITAERAHEGGTTQVVTTLVSLSRLRAATAAAAMVVAKITPPDPALVDLYAWADEPDTSPDELSARIVDALEAAGFAGRTERVTAMITGSGRDGTAGPGPPVHRLTFRRHGGGFVEDTVVRGMHPMVAERLALWRLSNFDLQRLASPQDTYLFSCVARDNPEDERLIAIAEIRELTPVRDDAGRVTALPELEQALAACLEGLRGAQAGRERRLHWNRVLLHVWPDVEVPVDELFEVARRLAPMTEGLGLEEVAAQARLRQTAGGALREQVVHLSTRPGTGLTIRTTDPPTEPLQPLDEYTQKVLKCRRRGTVYPYELVGTLSRPRGGTVEAGTFTEHDLDGDGRLAPVDRPYGRNESGIVAGVLVTPTGRHPEGITRVMLFGDPTKSLGAIAEPECRRVVAALDLAAELGVPVDWFALSAGARIAMDSGTENMDWIAAVLRRLIEFTQAGGEVNVVVAGINVGAQPYWNAEATMLLHTRGILVMTPESAMVLTGKQSLDYSGGVSAEDNVGIGGYERVMAHNGQGQYWVPDLAAACELLATHHEHGYVVPGERFPRRASTADPVERDVRDSPHQVEDCAGFTRVGDIFSEQTNPGRKKPFDMRVLMRALADGDHPSPERWEQMGDADTAIVLDTYLGGYPVTMLGIESRPLPRYGFLPADGPDQWTAGTLFPLSSKKTARALNAASGRRPAVVLANLSGFDGSPESLRRLQLEYGAEIGRAIVNFDGPIVFCVVSRYHGGAFVVFSGALNPNLEVVAVEGSYASVIGGAPAAAVVFAGEVASRTRGDPRVEQAEHAAAQADEGQRARLRAELADVRAAVHAEKLGEMAAEFDAVHDIERARQVGSVHRIVPAERLRPFLVDAVARGIDRTLDH